MLDRGWLRDTCYAPWREAQAAGLGVMIGETGAFQHTPHDVVLRWLEDLLAISQDNGWGWALWNFRGGFGVIDSKRRDVTYETWEGQPLDRAMLELLQKY
jgi:endoglucanase